MKFTPSRPSVAKQDRAIIPMINVVFLLLIFFLMTATLNTPDPFGIEPPIAEGAAEPDREAILHVSKSGELALFDLTDDEVWPALEAHESVLTLRVDAALPAADLIALTRRLEQFGLRDLRLVTVLP